MRTSTRLLLRRAAAILGLIAILQPGLLILQAARVQAAPAGELSVDITADASADIYGNHLCRAGNTQAANSASDPSNAPSHKNHRHCVLCHVLVQTQGLMAAPEGMSLLSPNPFTFVPRPARDIHLAATRGELSPATPRGPPFLS